ncbi:MAG: nucleotide sugar dehydrogenase, partial [Planctomycetes bacterium]|nr:nucleotide sugar dehydrogenase [Planctomycetota bacterium]
MRRISVVGLGYVGLPLAVAFSRRFPGTIGFDIDSARVRELRSGKDRTRTVEPGELAASGLRVTDDPNELRAADFHVVAVPTPIDSFKRPDLTALRGAARTVGAALTPGDIVVVESTVYPGVTDEVVAPILAQVSGLTRGRDFTVGYS